MSIYAVIFDLDGVIVSTDNLHFKAWKALADQEGIYFDKEINNRLRGVSRMESLNIILERSEKYYSSKEKKVLAQTKNERYRDFLLKITPNEILPGVISVLEKLKTKGIKIAVGSSSKNTPLILNQIGLGNYFDAVADGNSIKRSKPDPEVFLLAAKLLNVQPENCAVVEDALVGLEAALAGNMIAIGVGDAVINENATYSALNLSEICFDEILKI